MPTRGRKVLKDNPGDKQNRMSYCDMIEQLSLLNAQVQCNATAEVLLQVDIDALAEDIEGLTAEDIQARKEVVAAEVDTLRCAAEILGRLLATTQQNKDDDDDDDDDEQSPPLPGALSGGIWN